MNTPRPSEKHPKFIQIVSNLVGLYVEITALDIHGDVWVFSAKPEHGCKWLKVGEVEDFRR